jgi:hypothetical protein
MAQSLIDILIRARSQGRGEIQQMSQQLGLLDKAAGAAAGGLAGLAAGAAVAGLYQLADAMDEVARRGAVFEQLGDVLVDFAGSVNSSADAMIGAAKKAAQGTISEFELILNANRAIQFEVAKTPEQFAKLIELSTALGRAQGISDTQALEFITTGLARESRLILDNLGLIIDIDKATAVYAETLGKSADQLTQAERKAALLNEAFRQGATAIQANRDAADSAATQYERFDANVQNLKDSFGALLATASADTIGGLATQLAVLNEQLTGQRETGTIEAQLRALVELRDSVANEAPVSFLGIEFFGDSSDLVADLEKRIASLNAELQALRFPIGTMQEAASLSMQAGDAFTQQANASQAAAAAERERESAMHAAARAAAIDATETIALAASLDKLAGSAANAIVSRAQGIVGITGGTEAQRLAEQQLRLLQEQTLALESQGLSGLDLIFAYTELENKALGVFDAVEETDRATQRWASQGLAAANRQTSDLQRQFDQLQSSVAGVLQGALDPGVGVDVDSILPRGDAINEDARRLADVAVNGFDSPWADYLSNKFPDLFGEAFQSADIKTEAAKVLRDFQDGLTPELLDKDAAKERVRRMLIGEARLADLAQEIAGELASEFGGLNSGQLLGAAQSALGVGGGVLAPPDTSAIAEQYAGAAGTAGQAFAEGIRSSVVDGNLGDRVVTALDEQLRAEANLLRLEEGGRISGNAWGGGFLSVVAESVPTALIELLAQLVTPAVDSLQRQNTSLQGAR